MITKLIKIAQKLDASSRWQEADWIDSKIQKWAEEEPSDEELAEMEAWIERENLENLDQENLSGLSPKEREAAESYLTQTLEQIQEALTALRKGESDEEDLKQPLEHLDQMLTTIPLVSIPGLIAEARLSDLWIQTATEADNLKLWSMADRMDRWIQTAAEEQWDDREPSDQELAALEAEPESQLYEALHLLQQIADRSLSPEEAQEAAKAFLKQWDGSGPEVPFPSPPKGLEEEREGKVLPFPEPKA